MFLLAGGGSLAVRSQLVHHMRQQLRHHGRELARVDAELCGGLVQGVTVKDALELVGRDRQVLAAADPRADDSA